MLVEWLRKKWKTKKAFHPKDNLKYVISHEVIAYTTEILRHYGNLKPAAEGVVYWAGRATKNTYNIVAAIAPRSETSRYGIYTTHESNAKFVEFISDHDLLYFAQVHSHPSYWVDHSVVDNEETAFRGEGLVSIVVPHFGENGMTPLTKCGVHRYTDGQFKRLADAYVKKHFKIKKTSTAVIKDMRYE